jgi:hypothetical protein
METCCFYFHISFTRNISKCPSNDYRSRHALVRYCRFTVDVRIRLKWIKDIGQEGVEWISNSGALSEHGNERLDCIKYRGFLV